MKNSVKICMMILFACCFNNAIAGGIPTNPEDKTNGNNTDTTNNLKSNIIIFRMITNPSPASSNGSLKKAGKVARTSSSHSANRINTTVARTMS